MTPEDIVVGVLLSATALLGTLTFLGCAVGAWLAASRIPSIQEDLVGEEDW